MAPSHIPIATYRGRVPGGPTYDPTLMKTARETTPTKAMSTMAWIQAQGETRAMAENGVDETGIAQGENATPHQVEAVATGGNMTTEEHTSQLEHARQEKSSKLNELKDHAPVNNNHTPFLQPAHPNCIACGTGAGETSIELEIQMLKNEVKHAVGEMYLAMSNTRKEMMSLEGELDRVWNEFKHEDL